MIHGRSRAFLGKYSHTHGRFYSDHCKEQEPEGTKEEAARKEPSASASAEDKLSQLQDSYLRCLADMENLRQRTRREVDSASVFAIQKFCKDVIGVADVLELALGSMKGDARTAALLRGDVEGESEAENAAELQESTGKADSSLPSQATDLNAVELEHRLRDLAMGLSLTLSELLKVFAKHGVVPIDPLHQRFDPNVHMALYEIPRKDLAAGIVVSVQKKGYLLNERVIRPASVGVSKKI